MSELIVRTVVGPLVVGLIWGGSIVALRRPVTLHWLVAAVVVLLLYVLLEGLPPWPPISSKQKLGYLLLGGVALTSFTPRLPFPARISISVGYVVTSLLWLASTVLAAKAWAPALWLLPLTLLLAIGISALPKLDPDSKNDLSSRVPLLTASISGALVALLCGFVGMAQLLGALAASVGGSLLVGYAATVLGRGRRSARYDISATWLLGLTFATIIIMIACFAPTPAPLALYLAAATLIVHRFVPRLSNLNEALKPLAVGIASALPAAAAVAVAYFSRSA